MPAVTYLGDKYFGFKEWVDNENCFGIDYPIDAEELVKLVNEVTGRKLRM